MATVRLNGDASGYVELKAPNAAGSNSLILPNGNGSASQYLQTDGAGSLVWADPFRLTQGTAKDWNWNGLTTNTSIDFTSIPNWVKRVTVMFNGVSTNGTSAPMIRLGTSSGFVTSGYVAATSRTTTVGTSTAGFILSDATAAAFTNEGIAQIANVTGNAWTFSSNITLSGNACASGAGSISSANLGGVLTQVRITTVNGTDTFDAGTINIMWEG
jgi:hypothetical protein